MAIYAQHGYGKGTKIERGLSEGVITGVILSPRDENPANLATFSSQIRREFPEAAVLIDPQFFANTIDPIRPRFLEEYPDLYFGSLTRTDFTSRNIQRYVKSVIEWQSVQQVTRILSPTVWIPDLGGPWGQIAIMMASESVEYYNLAGFTTPLLLTIVVSEEALRAADDLDEFLNVMSGHDVAGFYLIVRRSQPAYRGIFEPDSLEGLLRMCHSLAQVNEYELIVGFCDIVGFLLHAVGTTATGVGWLNNLRQFTFQRFEPSTGGRPARPRYTSGPLLNSILVSELDDLFTLGQLGSVLSGTIYDAAFTGATNPLNAQWLSDESALHHWDVLRSSAEVVSIGSIQDRINESQNIIANASGLYSTLSNVGAQFETNSSGGHLSQWRVAVDRFRNAAGI